MKDNYEVTLKQVIAIIHKTINSVDTRLLNHGERVAYIMLNLLKEEGNYEYEDILRICAVSTFHDIGAYKVTERDKLTQVDIVSPYKHAVYGSLFIKYFSPLSDLYNIVMTHHFSLKCYKTKNIEIISKEGLLLHFVDYVDRIYLNKDFSFEKLLKHSDENFLKEHVDLFIKAEKKYNFMSKISDGSYAEELYNFFDTKTLSREDVVAYGKMLAYSIDFRSEATVKHTITVEAISYQIAKLYGLSDKKLTIIKIAAVLHDIGKIGVPVEILEKPGKLTEEEFEIIKSHAIIGYNILSGLGIDDIRDIGTMHHEKLDGAGYPFGLKGDQLTKEMRIIAIADIVSALIGIRSYKDSFNKEKITKILSDMVNYNKIDREITKLFIDNYDYVIEEATNEWNGLMNTYLNIKEEYEEIMKQFS